MIIDRLFVIRLDGGEEALVVRLPRRVEEVVVVLYLCLRIPRCRWRCQWLSLWREEEEEEPLLLLTLTTRLKCLWARMMVARRTARRLQWLV
jgi:hypothetical protein